MYCMWSSFEKSNKAIAETLTEMIYIYMYIYLYVYMYIYSGE